MAAGNILQTFIFFLEYIEIQIENIVKDFTHAIMTTAQ